ncbi:hypothetical protein GCM10022222_67270 [Amycolatopsis ultiminotia]|uniref:YbhB/YbcL family Raf kinase inhibitor-like protein n=1 Tax=Amycolatopsis ultiminotia TaxID=543629 RepID=A0ABP6XXA3_9PSEU
MPSFTLTSRLVKDGGELALPQFSGIFGVPGGEDTSPDLAWSGAPAATESYAVTMYDPDAPTGSGFWHWAVVNLPSDVTALREGAGSSDDSLPPGAFHLANDGGARRFVGAAPPAGHGRHRYFLVVHALAVRDPGVSPDATPAFLGFTMAAHIVGRAVLTATAEIPA